MVKYKFNLNQSSNNNLKFSTTMMEDDRSKMIRNCITSDGPLLPAKLNRGTLVEIPQICIDAFCEHAEEAGADKNGTNHISEDVDGNGLTLTLETSCTAPPKNNTDTVSWSTNRAFFLTHYDEAVLNDVLDPRFLTMLVEAPNETVRLYMHELTYEFLLYWTRKEDDNVDQVFCLLLQLRQKHKIIFLETNRSIKLIFPNVEINPRTLIAKDLVVEVTSISAGHNPGSIMLLIEKVFDDNSLNLDSIPESEDEFGKILLEEEMRILYTGSCRVTLADLEACSSFYHRCGEKKIITSLYIDSTYCLTHVEELPSRKHVEDELVQLIRDVFLDTYQEPKLPDLIYQTGGNNSIHVEIWTPSIHGGLNFMRTLYETFEVPIHVPRRLAIFLEQVPNFRECWQRTRLKPFPTQEHQEGQISFHYCCKAMEEIEVCFNSTHINRLNISLQCNMFSSPVGQTEDEMQLHNEDRLIYFKDPDIHHGIYSMNLSKFEMARVINFCGVDPLKVKPLFRPRYMTIEQLYTCIKQACDDVRECQPTDFNEDSPSTAYDFTDEAAKLKEINNSIRSVGVIKGRKARSVTQLFNSRFNSRRTNEFYHYYENDLYNALERYDPLYNKEPWPLPAPKPSLPPSDILIQKPLLPSSSLREHSGQGDSAIPSQCKCKHQVQKVSASKSKSQIPIPIWKKSVENASTNSFVPAKPSCKPSAAVVDPLDLTSCDEDLDDMFSPRLRQR